MQYPVNKILLLQGSNVHKLYSAGALKMANIIQKIKYDISYLTQVLKLNHTKQSMN